MYGWTMCYLAIVSLIIIKQGFWPEPQNSINTRWMQGILRRAWVSCTMVWNGCWLRAKWKQMLPTSYDRQTESSNCCIQQAPSWENGNTLLCFISITTCNILCLSWQFACLITYNFTGILCGHAVAACAMLQQCHRHNIKFCVHPNQVSINKWGSLAQ